MNRILLFCVCLLSASHQLIAQTFGSHKIALTPVQNPFPSFNKDEYRERLMKRYSNSENPKLVEKYIKETSFSMEQFFLSNEVYSNWPEATDLVKQVFQKTVPPGYSTDNIKIYVCRITEPNAFCMEDGNIIVTAGLLAMIDNEAELAATLSHEFGHFYLNHAFNDFKTREENKEIKQFVSANSLLGNVVLRLDESSYQVNQERAADTFAVNFFRTNGYCPNAIVRDFEEFERYQNKCEKYSGYRKPLIYFKTHPSNAERISNAKKAMAGRLTTGSNFQNDSIEFFKIKKRAVDEVIYLLFESMQYQEAIEQSYTQLLFTPGDEFYQYILIESLRRQMCIDPEFGKEFFITGAYKNIKPVTTVDKPVFLKGKNGKELSEKNFRRSVFANYRSEIFDFNDRDLGAVNARALVTNDTLEFLYNSDALNYFIENLKSENCVFKLPKKLVNAGGTFECTLNETPTEIEKELADVSRFYQQVQEQVKSYQKSPVILLDIHSYNKFGKPEEDLLKKEELLKSYNETANAVLADNLYRTNAFNFREREKLSNLTHLISMFGLNKFFGSKTHQFNLIDGMPEFCGLISKYQLRNIIFLDLLAMPGLLSERWVATIYKVDLVNKKTVALTIKASKTSRNDQLKEILDQCSKEARK